MKKTALFALSLLSSFGGYSQSFPPAAGQPGSTAMHKTDVSFVGWATGIQVTRGYKKISDPSLGFASTGLPANAIGAPTGAVVSLGDRGEAVATFHLPVIDGPGFDFAVFENGNVGYLELGIVKVSSDGVNYFGFPTYSQTQASSQLGTFGTPQAIDLNNLAGKYDGAYGTPFDISEIPDHPLLDKNNITHIKIIDVVGSIDSQYATYDSQGHAINDSFPTPFDSGGFDLQAVGVIHERSLGLNDFDKPLFTLYPNPASSIVFLEMDEEATMALYDLSGRMVRDFPKGNYKKITISDLDPGIYLLWVSAAGKNEVRKLIIE